MTAPAGIPAAPAAPAPPAAPAAATPPAPADGGNNWTPPATQADLDRIIKDRLDRQTRVNYGGLTPEQVTEIKSKADAAEAANATDVQRAAADAQKAANEAADAKYRPMLAETAFRVAIGDAKPAAEVDEFVADLNLSRFLKDDGTVDTAKVLSRVKQFIPPAAPTRTTPAAPKGPVVPGHQSGPAPAGAGDQARQWLTQQGIEIKTG